jgi:FeS assembly SUF system protein
MDNMEKEKIAKNTAEEKVELNELSMRDKVLEAIKQVYDPEIPVDIYELGLIYEINVYPVNNVFVLMTLTSPSCPAAESIPSEVEQRIRKIAKVQNVKVEVTFDPPYTTEMMSEAAKLELGFL